MSEPKNWRKTLAGLLFVQEDEEQTKPAGDETEALLAKYAEEAPAKSPEVAPLAGDPTISPAVVDFAQVFAAGGVGAAEQDCMAKAAELLAALPVETTMDVKRQIVEASLRVFKFPIDSIIQAGKAELEALDAFLGIGESTAQRVSVDSATRIQQLESEIVSLRALVDARRREQEGQRRACSAKKAEILGVLGFFGQAPVKPVQEEPQVGTTPPVQEEERV